ncbi:hypothetical protein AX17_006649 [Amanita inopinata Kibby_2008]|nr:hypothetical protein AX17_006649 [Amanita inopinata Kibby_2008]
MPTVSFHLCFFFLRDATLVDSKRFESDQGAPYPVLIRQQGSIRKPPRPPPTSTPLDDDFDALTQDGNTTQSVGEDSAVVGRGARRPRPRRDWETQRTSSPLDEDFDLVTYTGGITTETNTQRGSMYSVRGGAHQNEDGRLGDGQDGGYRRYEGDVGRVIRRMGDMEIGGGGRVRSPDSPSRSSFEARNTVGRPRERRAAARDSWSGSGSGPKFEVVRSQVVEDGPERTVTVSLWKEQVAKPIGPNGETMSVHYYSAEDVLPDELLHAAQMGGRRGDDDCQAASGSDKRSQLSQPWNQTPPRTPDGNHNPHSPRSPGRSTGTANRSDVYYRHISPSRPHDNASFRPTQSVVDTTISSIKSLPTIEMEKILDACEPSLVHVAPILSSLGITREEHLRAIVRLSEETRDREVKEEALRLGMTVMEWAILLDKLQSL